MLKHLLQNSGVHARRLENSGEEITQIRRSSRFELEPLTSASADSGSKPISTAPVSVDLPTHHSPRDDVHSVLSPIPW